MMSPALNKKRGLWIPDFAIVIISLLWIVAVLYFVLSSGKHSLTFFIIIMGILLFLCFSIISFSLIKNQLPFGIYASLALVSLLLTIEQFNYEFTFDSRMHSFTFIGSMSFLFLVAMTKLWSIFSS